MSATLSGLSAACRSTQLTVKNRKFLIIILIYDLSNFDLNLTGCIELAPLEPGELCLPHVAVHDGVKVLEPVELRTSDPAPKLLWLKS